MTHNSLSSWFSWLILSSAKVTQVNTMPKEILLIFFTLWYWDQILFNIKCAHL